MIDLERHERIKKAREGAIEAIKAADSFLLTVAGPEDAVRCFRIGLWHEILGLADYGLEQTKYDIAVARGQQLMHEHRKIHDRDGGCGDPNCAMGSS